MTKMISLFFFFLVLTPSFISSHLSDPWCFWRIKDIENYLGDKDTDCFFSIYTRRGYVKNDYFSGNLDKQVTPATIHLISSLYFAMEEINRNLHILPNISLQVKIECNLMNHDQKTGLSLKRKELVPNYYCTNQRRYLIVLTGPMFLSSTKVGRFLYISRTPELYCGNFDFRLRDNEQFPHLYQISPKDTSLPLAMLSLMVHLGWNWLGVIITDNDHGFQFFSQLKTEVLRNPVCLSFVTIIAEDFKLYIKMLPTYSHQILMSSAKVVIVYGDKDSNLQLTFIIWKSLDIWRLWVSVSQFDMITIIGDFLLKPTPGTLIFSHQHSELLGFKQFMQTMHPLNYTNEMTFAKLWWTHFRCSLPPSTCKNLKNCPINTVFKWLLRSPLGMSMSDTSYNLYNAVYAVGHSLHEILQQEVDTWSKNPGKEPEFDSWKVFSFMKNIQFVNPAGDLVLMNQNLKQDTEYDIFYITNFQKQYGLKMKIGRFSGHAADSQKLYTSEEMIKWATDIYQTLPSICSMPCRPGHRKSPHEDKAACCFDCYPCPNNQISNLTNMDQCVKCPEDEYANTDQTHCLKKAVTFLDYVDPLGMALAVLALFFSLLTSVVLCVFLKHQDSPIVKANNQILSYVLLISLIFCFICPMLYIGHPSMVRCILQQTTFAIGFTVAASSVLAKTITVVLAFKITVPGRRLRGLLVSGAPNYIILICTTIQLIICGIWLRTSPPFVDTDVQMVYDHIIIVCNKGSVIAFYCALGYMGFIALASFTVAFLARNLPDTFNEAKLLTFSMLVFCSVWITFLPVYHSSKGKAMVTVESFCILASSAGLLLCIFVPKCYIILLRPEMNSVQKLSKTLAKAENIEI